MIAKDETVVVVPVTDVRKVGGYSLEKAIESIKKVRSSKDLEGEQDGQEEKS